LVYGGRVGYEGGRKGEREIEDRGGGFIEVFFMLLT
jgi:hypothetical protein